MFKLDSKKLILILLGLVVLGGIGVGGYRYYQSTRKEPARPPIKDKEEKIYEIVNGEIYPEWKKFINYAAGYSLELPPESKIEVSLEGRVLGVSFNAIVGDAMWMDISEYGNPKNLSVKEWAEEDGFRDKHKWILREWKTTVGGNNAYCFFYSKPAGFSQATFIENGDKMCILTFGVSAGLDDHNGKFLESWLSKILSTFKVLG